MQQLGQMQATISQDHGFSGSGHAVYDSMARADSSRESLLLQIHHFDDVGDLQTQARSPLLAIQAGIAAAF